MLLFFSYKIARLRPQPWAILLTMLQVSVSSGFDFTTTGRVWIAPIGQCDETHHFTTYYITFQSPNPQKRIQPTYNEIMMKYDEIWWNYDETYDETYDVIAMKAVSKCLAWMKGCWDPEFEPSIEEIVDYRWYNMAILSVCFLWRARTLGGFPYSIQHMAGGGHIRCHSGFVPARQFVPGELNMLAKLFQFSRKSADLFQMSCLDRISV